MPNPTTFTFVRDLPLTPNGSIQKLWCLDHPIPLDSEGAFTHYVISSFAHSAMLLSIQGQPELYLFPADESGEVIDWSELPGSQKGSPSHEEVLTAFINSFTE